MSRQPPRRREASAEASRARTRETFLAALARTGNVSEAARKVGVHPTLPYAWRKEDPDFAVAWNAAVEIATDALEAEARRRGVEGWLEPVFREKGQIGTIRRYSDRMLEILLKGHRTKFRENQKLEVSGPGGTPIHVVHEPDAAALAEAARILARQGQPAPDDEVDPAQPVPEADRVPRPD